MGASATSEASPLRLWAAREIEVPGSPVASARASFANAGPLLAALPMAPTREVWRDLAREALLRQLDLLGAPTLARYASTHPYRQRLRATGLLDETGIATTLLDGRAARIAVQGLLIWPADTLLWQTLLSAVQVPTADPKA